MPMSRKTVPATDMGWLARRSLKIGLLSFGGPAAQIALMHREFVEDGGKVSETRFLNALNYCMLLPGPEAQQLATYCGWIVAGVRGGLVSGLLFILPGALAMLAVSLLYVTLGSTGIVASLFYGIKAGVLAIVLQALLRLGRRALTSAGAWAIALAAFLALFLFDLPFPLVIVAAGLAGALGLAAPPRAEAEPDADPAPTHSDGRARGGWRSGLGASLRTVAIALLLWGLPVALAALALSPRHVLIDIAGFFSTMAVVSFGGAYALLSYMAQVAVETQGWLAPGEMLDGLGLAETTPGPLILVTQFVGFLGGFRDPAPFDPLIAGTLAAAMTTWVTFAPSFLFVLAGAPHIDRIQQVRWLSRMLSAITAAVVGTILNLSLWFAINVLFREVGTLERAGLSAPLPVPASLDPWIAGLAGLAAVLLFVLKRGVAEVVLVTALAGVALKLSGVAD